MDGEEESVEGRSGGPTKHSGRSWTERSNGKIRYQRFSDVNGGGRPSIFYRFEVPPGQDEVPQAVYDILNSLKRMDRGGHERGGGDFFTGLKFRRDTRHGKVWELPDTPTGRTVADMLDSRLAELACRVEGRGLEP
jgi:hypothetical protein